MLSKYWFTKLGKMIESEDGDGFYEIHERYAATLLDEGFIECKRWCQNTMGYVCSFSGFFTTEKGRKAYQEWKDDSST